ncbi:MAG: hypothetical protein Q9170_002000 [Blastenia crenularia]
MSSLPQSSSKIRKALQEADKKHRANPTAQTQQAKESLLSQLQQSRKKDKVTKAAKAEKVPGKRSKEVQAEKARERADEAQKAVEETGAIAAAAMKELESCLETSKEGGAIKRAHEAMGARYQAEDKAKELREVAHRKEEAWNKESARLEVQSAGDFLLDNLHEFDDQIDSPPLVDPKSPPSPPPSHSPLPSFYSPPPPSYSPLPPSHSPSPSNNPALGQKLQQSLAERLFGLDFPQGAEPIFTSADGFLCGFYAFIASWQVRYHDLTPPKIEDLVTIWKSDDCRSFFRAGGTAYISGEELNENFLGADQVAPVVTRWGDSEGYNIHIGYVKRRKDSDIANPSYESTVLLSDPEEGEYLCWIEHNGQDGTLAHWSGLSPKTSPPPTPANHIPDAEEGTMPPMTVSSSSGPLAPKTLVTKIRMHSAPKVCLANKSWEMFMFILNAKGPTYMSDRLAAKSKDDPEPDNDGHMLVMDKETRLTIRAQCHICSRDQVGKVKSHTHTKLRHSWELVQEAIEAGDLNEAKKRFGM